MRRMDEGRQESQAIKDMVSLVHEYELSRIPDNHELQQRYELSDVFYQKMERMIECQEKKARRKKTTTVCGCSSGHYSGAFWCG